MKRIHNSDASALSAESSALERLFELGVRLTDGMDQGLAERGLTRARAEVIWRLQAGKVITQRELSQALRVTPRNVTGLVDALEATGFVKRRPHPTDRRATLVGLTAQGDAAARRMRKGYRQLGSRLFVDLSTDEVDQLNAFLDRLLAQLRGDADQPIRRRR